MVPRLQHPLNTATNTTFCSQVNYADLLQRVDPLRQELRSLEEEADRNKMEGEEMNRLVQELEKSIARYKEEYAVLISQAEAIKASLLAVEEKVISLSVLIIQGWTSPLA